MFEIELRNPTYALPKGDGFDLKAIFSTCFDFPNENFTINWSGLKIDCSYDHNVGHILWSVFDVIEKLTMSRLGDNETILFGMNNFIADWNISWNNTDVVINSKWDKAPRNIEEKLNKESKLEINKVSFLKEWNKLFKFTLDIVERSGIEIFDDYYSLERLKRMSSAIDKL